MAARHTCHPYHQVSTILWSFASSRHMYQPAYNLNANLQLLPTKTTPYVSCGIDIIYISLTCNYKKPTYVHTKVHIC